MLNVIASVQLFTIFVFQKYKKHNLSSIAQSPVEHRVAATNNLVVLLNAQHALVINNNNSNMK